MEAAGNKDSTSPPLIIAHRGEDLRLATQPAKCRRMDDPISVALEWPAVRVRRLGVLSPTTIETENRVRRKQRTLTFIRLLQRGHVY